MGWGPIPPRPPPPPHAGSISCLHAGLAHGGVPSPPPGRTAAPTMSPRHRGSAHAHLQFPPILWAARSGGGGRGLRFGRGGGGKAANLPHACNQSNQPQLPAGRRTGLHSPLWERGDGRRMHKHPPTQNTPGCPPGRAAPPQPPPCSPPAPHGFGARRQRVPKAERRAEQRAERSPPPSEQEETPPHVPPLGSGSVLTSPRAGGGPWAARCPPVLQP